MDTEKDCFIYQPHFEPGDLAWAKVKGYKWWPSLVCNDPETKTCIKTANKKTQCHVQFFDERRSRAWVHAKEIKPFRGSDDPDFNTPGGQFHSKTKSIISAAEEADKYINLSRFERLKIEQPESTEMSDLAPGPAGDAPPQVKADPDLEEMEAEPEVEMETVGDPTAAGEALRAISSSPESILTEMKEEPPDELTGDKTAAPGEVAVAVHIKEETEEGQEEEEDYSESEMETIEKGTEGVAAEAEDVIRTVTPTVPMPVTKPAPKSAAKPGPKSSKKPGPKSSKKPGPKSSKKTGPKSSKKGASSEEATPSTSKEGSPGPVPGIYKVTDVPKHMQKSFVLLSTESIPPDASPEKSIPLNTGKTPRSTTAKKGRTPKAQPGKSKGGKSKGKAADKESEETAPNTASESGVIGGRRKSKAKVSYKEDEFITEEDMDFDEEEILDSDEDPGWMPSKKKGGSGAKGKRKRGGVTSGDDSEAEEEDSEPESDFEDELLGISRKRQPAKKKSKTGSQQKTRDRDREPTIIEEPTGFQPTVGDYLIDKNSIKDGLVPTIWLFKKGGIIQKYNRIEEDGELLFESAQWFSDWWDDYGDRYAAVKTQVKFKHQNKVKVTVTEWPEDMATWENPVNGSVTSSKTTGATTSENKENKSPGKSKETNDTEVSSTTTYGDEEFQIGRYVIDKKDVKNVDNFSIWKIESGILLKKFEMHIVKGKMMHKPVKVYRGYRDIGDFYQPVKIKRVVDLMSDYVEVDEASRPKLSYDEGMEIESEKNPLLQHFYVYLQVLLSQALEPGFLEEVFKKKEDTYMVPIAEIDKLVKQKMDQIERKLRWNTTVKAALQKCPFLREVHKPVENSVCEGLQECDETVDETIFLFGDEYDKDNLKSSKGSEGSQEFKIGKTAAKNVSSYHQLCHFKYNLYDKCQAKIKLVQESKYGAPTIEETMDACLHNKAWVLQNFQDLMELIQNT